MITKENAKQYQTLLEAFIAGKTIQIYLAFDEEWKDVQPGFSFSSGVEHYRIKPVRLKTRQYIAYYAGSKTYKIHTVDWETYSEYEDNSFEEFNQFIRWVGEWTETEV